MHGFILGISTGATCLAYCSPALLPFLLGQGSSFQHATYTLLKFLVGRLLGYIMFALFAFITKHYIAILHFNLEIILGLAYTFLAILLFTYGLTTPTTKCPAHTLSKLPSHIISKHPQIIPTIIGFLTGLNICPPFMLVFSEAVGAQSLVDSMLFFFTFFLGTCLYFLPIPFVSLINHMTALKIIGKMMAVLMSIYYFYSGMIILIGGIKTI